MAIQQQHGVFNEEVVSEIYLQLDIQKEFIQTWRYKLVQKLKLLIMKNMHIDMLSNIHFDQRFKDRKKT